LKRGNALQDSTERKHKPRPGRQQGWVMPCTELCDAQSWAMYGAGGRTELCDAQSWTMHGAV